LSLRITVEEEKQVGIEIVKSKTGEVSEISIKGSGGGA